MPTKAKLLRIYVGESVRCKGKSVYHELFKALKEAGLAGVTVFRGVEGYGQLKKVHTTRLLELSADLPMVVECIDTPEKIDAILPKIKSMIPRGLVATLDVKVEKWSE